jgi:hypothetical protein
MKFKDDIERKKIYSLFEAYMSNLPDNFYKNQFELVKEYGGTFEDWVKILIHQEFATWKNEQVAIIASVSTDKALAGGDLTNKDALPLLKARQEILNDEKNIEKPTIIVLPDCLYFKGPDE